MRALTRSLGTVSLVFVLYFSTSGGPFTTETLVRDVGPGLALLIMLLVPLFWSVPEVLIVGELASMLPEEGGYYRWVQRAFGPFWAFQNGWLTWMYSLVDMAIYPVLFVQYLRYFAPGAEQWSWAIMLAMIWGATAINLRGAFPVGRVSVALGTFIIVGFFIAAAVALPHVHATPWRPFMAPNTNLASGLAVGLSIALWNYIGWDNASTVQGEVRDASRSFPRALAFALPLVVVGYFIPLLASLGATDWRTWSDGSWPAIVQAAAGGGVSGIARWLAGWIGLAGMASALALFNALLLEYSRIPFVIADDGLLPRLLARTDRRGTPVPAVVFSAVLYSVFVLVPFGRLVIADVLLYSLALFLEFGALVRLRKSEPELRGVFRIPVGRGGVTVLAAVPMAILVLLVVLSLRDGEYGVPALIGAVAAIGLGPIIYRLSNRGQRNPDIPSGYSQPGVS